MNDPAQEKVNDILADKEVREFIVTNLKQSLASIGFKSDLIQDLTDNLHDLDVGGFVKKHESELKHVHDNLFFNDAAKEYFSKHVVPEVPKSEVVLDLGCGPGILAGLLAESENFNKVLAWDIKAYSTWENSDNIQFAEVSEEQFPKMIEDAKPDSITLTWVLHHMEFDEQERYLSYLRNGIEKGTRVVFLEDTYSTKLLPRDGVELHNEFMKRDEAQRKNIMAVYDWVANRVLARRGTIPIPFTFRSLEEWKDFCAQYGFKTVKQKYIGFPERRDVNTPQGLFVLEKE